MTAAFGPVEEIVGNDNPTKFSCLLRIASSLSAACTSSSTVPFLTSSSSSQEKYSLNAAPSRIWHLRMPSSSVSFLIAFASPTGLRTSSTLSSPPSSSVKAHEALLDTRYLVLGEVVSGDGESASALTSSKIASYGRI